MAEVDGAQYSTAGASADSLCDTARQTWPSVGAGLLRASPAPMPPPAAPAPDRPAPPAPPAPRRRDSVSPDRSRLPATGEFCHCRPRRSAGASSLAAAPLRPARACARSGLSNLLIFHADHDPLVVRALAAGLEQRHTSTFGIL